MKIVATYSIKGGVGKTAAAVNLGYEASRSGLTTLIWDLDPQGAATYSYRIKPKVKGGARAVIDGDRDLDDAIRATDYDNLDLVPADFSFRNFDVLLDEQKKPTRRVARLLKPLRDTYDLVILDCPPSLSLGSESVIEACDALLVPVIPTPLSIRTLDQLASFVADEDRDVTLLPFFSMVHGRRQLHIDAMKQLRAKKGTLLETVIPASSTIERVSAERAPVAAFAPKSVAARSFASLWKETEAALYGRKSARKRR